MEQQTKFSAKNEWRWHPGIIEYLSQTYDCADFLNNDEKYRYIEDLSILEIVNLISVGITS